MGHPEAMYNLAICYEAGNGVKQNFEKSLEWYTKAAEAGYFMAQFALGQRYDNGMSGVEQDYALAVKWYEKCAEYMPYVKCRLGVMYYKGLGVDVNYLDATLLMEQNMDMDNTGEVKYLLGKCYKEGLGVFRDEAKGQKLIDEALALGYDPE